MMFPNWWLSEWKLLAWLVMFACCWMGLRLIYWFFELIYDAWRQKISLWTAMKVYLLRRELVELERRRNLHLDDFEALRPLEHICFNDNKMKIKLEIGKLVGSSEKD